MSKADPLNGLKPWMKLTWRTSLAVVGLAVGILNILAARKIVPLSTTWQVVIIVALGALTAVDNTRLAVRRAKEPGEEERRLRIHKTLLGALIVISENRGVRVSHLGSSVFVERRVGLLRRKALVRRERVRISEFPPATEIKWEKGKGAVGTCWETGATVHRDRRKVAEKYTGVTLNESQWKGVSAKSKSGFSRTEFVSMVGKYAEILAVPIRSSSGELIGIVSVDLTVDAPDGRMVLEGRDVEVLVTESTVIVRDDIARL